MTCAKCGAPLRPGAMFCGECGARVEARVSPPPAPASPAGWAPSAPIPPAGSVPRNFAPAPPPPPPPPVAAPTPPPPPPVAAPHPPPPPPVSAVSSVAVREEVAGPQPTVPVQRLEYAPAAAASLDDDDDLEATIIAPRRSSTWKIVTPAGDVHPIRETTVIGRSPMLRPGAATLPLVDPTKSLSKSHALLTVTPEGLLVEDLGSTNGTIVHDGSTELDLGLGQRMPLAPGMTLELGEYILTIQQG